MNDSRPIGVFDSGIGGLTIVQALMQELPQEQILYVGDTAHLPYGDKSPAQVRSYATAITQYLVKQDVKAIVIACNTATAVALDVVRQAAGSIPVYEVISPAVQAALAVSSSKIIGVIGTRTTVASGAYQERIHQLEPNAQVITRATPLLVPLIEEGWKDTHVMQEVLATYLDRRYFASIDSLVLGCTHYPMIARQIQQLLAHSFPAGVSVITSSATVAAEVATDLAQRGLLRSTPDVPRHQFWVSDLTPGFQDHASLFLQQDVQLRALRLGS
ncbi:MAG: glutamate racemase [Sphingobacteriia bacterium]